MDPVSLALIGTAATAGGAVLGAVSTSNAMRAQAKVDQERSAAQGQWAERRAQEELASSQRSADQRMREGKLAESRLQATAGASGSKATDPTVMNLFGGIESEARVNAGNEMAAGQQKAAGLKYGADLDKWAADANAAIKNSAADSTLIGGILSGVGAMGTGMSKAGLGFSSMGLRYANYDPAWSNTQVYKYG